MALTKVYKVGGVLFIDVAGGDNFEVEYPAMKMESVDVLISDIIEEYSISIPIADVRDEGNVAIGGQTAAEVRTYIATEIGK